MREHGKPGFDLFLFMETAPALKASEPDNSTQCRLGQIRLAQ